MVLLIGAALLRRTAAGRFPMHRAARLLQAVAVAWIALFLLMITHSAYVEASRPSPSPQRPRCFLYRRPRRPTHRRSSKPAR